MKISVFAIIIVFLMLFSCRNQQDEDLNLKHINCVAESINKDLNSVKQEVLNLANSLQYKIPFDKKVFALPENKYHYHPGEILFSSYSQNQSAVYYPADKIITNQLKNIIVNSENLDTLFISAIKRNPMLSQVYFLDTNSFLRIYPYIDAVSYLKNSADLRSFCPYQTVKEKPFIHDNVYWIKEPYADPYGRGWVISCVEPIYYRDRFIGILSGDITLRSIKNKYFSSCTELILLIDREGRIICSTKQVSKITHIPTFREFPYYKPVTEDIYIFNYPSLINHKNKNLRKAIKTLMSGKNKTSFYIENKRYTIYKSHIRETDWLLLKIIN